MNAPAPRANPDLIGHEAVEAQLGEAFASGRLAHAWLLTGPKGIGKATLAFRFVRYVLAHGTTGGGPASAGGDLFGPAAPAPVGGVGLALDPGHPVFRRVASGGHVDLMTVERSPTGDEGRRRTEIVAEDVRGVGPFLRLTAGEGGWRAVVIDSADDLNRTAANALLKVLEEPSARSLIVLVSHRPGRLLPTIRSRCLRLALQPLSDAHVRTLIGRYAPEVGEGEAAVLARLASGSIGRALTLASEGGLEMYRDLAGVLAGLPEMDRQAVHRLADRLARSGAEESFATMADLLLDWLGRLIAGAAGRGGANDDEAQLGARLQAGGRLDRWLDVWDKTNRLLAQAGGLHLDRKQVVLNAFHLIERAARP